MNNRYLKLAALAAVGTLAFGACGSNNTTTSSSSAAGGSSAGGSSAGSSSSAAGGSSSSSSSSSAAGGSSSKAPQAQGTLTGGGASTQQAAMQAWQSGIAASQPNLQVQYSPTGSGAGVSAFLAGQQQFANSDKPLSADEWTKSKSVCGDQGGLNIPVYISPIAIAYNVPGVTQSLKMSPDTIAKIFAGKITNWNADEIKQENSGVTLPDLKITTVHRADKSGTTFNFTDYLKQAAPSSWSDAANEVWPSSLSGETGQGTAGVVKVIQGTEGAIGYADASAVGDLKSVSPKVGSSYVPMSSGAAAKILDGSKVTGGESANDMGYTLNRTGTDSSVYPIALVSYQIFCNSYKDQQKGNAAKAWAQYVVSSQAQQDAAKAAGSAPLSDAISKKAADAINAIKVGS